MRNFKAATGDMSSMHLGRMIRGVVNRMWENECELAEIVVRDSMNDVSAKFVMTGMDWEDTALSPIVAWARTLDNEYVTFRYMQPGPVRQFSDIVLRNGGEVL